MSHMGVGLRRAAARKDLFDMLNTMREAAWQSFDKRRDVEWRTCIAFWVLLLAIAGGLVQHVQHPLGLPARVLLTLLLAELGVLHAFFTNHLAKAMRIDKIKAQAYEDRVKGMLGVDLGPEYYHRVWGLEEFVGCPLHHHATALINGRAWLGCEPLHWQLRRFTQWPRTRQSEHDRAQRPGSERECRECREQTKCHRHFFPLAGVRDFWSHASQLLVTWLLIGLDCIIIWYGIT